MGVRTLDKWYTVTVASPEGQEYEARVHVRGFRETGTFDYPEEEEIEAEEVEWTGETPPDRYREAMEGAAMTAVVNKVELGDYMTREEVREQARIDAMED